MACLVQFCSSFSKSFLAIVGPMLFLFPKDFYWDSALSVDHLGENRYLNNGEASDPWTHHTSLFI